jgi:hypothetical protein
MPRDPFPDWQTESAVQVLEHYLALAQCGSVLGLAFVDSVVMDVFCEMVEADAGKFRGLLEGKQMTMEITEREREILRWSDPAPVPYAQTCKLCGQEFYYHYPVHYCPECEDVVCGEQGRTTVDDYIDKDALAVERARREYRKPSAHWYQKTERYEIVNDPIPLEEGGFAKGARMNKEDVKTGIQLESFVEGTEFLYHGMSGKETRYRVEKKGATCELVAVRG